MFKKNYAKVSGKVSRLKFKIIEGNIGDGYDPSQHLTRFQVGYVPLFYEAYEDEAIPLDVHEGEEVEVWYKISENLLESLKGWFRFRDDTHGAYRILAIHHVRKHTFTQVSQGKSLLQYAMRLFLMIALIFVLGFYFKVIDNVWAYFVMVGIVLVLVYFSYQNEKKFEEEFSKIMEEYEDEHFYIDADKLN